MAARIHLVRHAESVHNVDKDFSRLDPSLTSIGIQQAQDLGRKFPHSESVGLVISSPLRRAIQTTLEAFTNVLDRGYFDENSGHGIQEGAKLLLEPDLQERSSLLCDTGSDRQDLETLFPSLDFSSLRVGWQLKEGFYSADEDAVKRRAKEVRHRLREQVNASNDSRRKDIVVVTHGVFMKYLAEDPDIDLPKAGWKTYTIQENADGSVGLKEA